MNNPFANQAPIEGVKHVLLVGSGKGGVGKSTVSINLAYSLKQLGHKVGLLDSDIYGPSIPRMVGALNQPPQLNDDKKLNPIVRYGVKLMSIGFLIDETSSVVWRGPMLFKAMDQFFRDVDWGDLDFLIIDLPPGTGDVPLTIAQKIPVSGSLIVSTPQNISLIDAKKAVDMFHQVNVPLLGVVENMSYMLLPGSDEKVQLFPKGELDQYLSELEIDKLAEVPFNPMLGTCAEAGMPLVESSPDLEESKAFKALAEKVAKRFF